MRSSHAFLGRTRFSAPIPFTASNFFKTSESSVSATRTQTPTTKAAYRNFSKPLTESYELRLSPEDALEHRGNQGGVSPSDSGVFSVEVPHPLAKLADLHLC